MKRRIFLVCLFYCFFRLPIYESIAAIFWQSASYVFRFLRDLNSYKTRFISPNVVSFQFVYFSFIFQSFILNSIVWSPSRSKKSPSSYLSAFLQISGLSFVFFAISRDKIEMWNFLCQILVVKMTEFFNQKSFAAAVCVLWRRVGRIFAICLVVRRRWAL